MGIKFEDEIFGLLLLNSLPESWETFKVSIINSAPNGVVSLQMVKGSVLNKEMRRKAQGSSSQSEILVIANRGRSQKKERERSRSKSKSLYKNENKGKKDKSKEKDDDDDDRVITTTSDDRVILRDFESVNLVSDESMWIIGSSATLHRFCLHTNTGMQLWLRGVKHALNVRFNLISLHMLDDGGYDNHFGYGKWKHTKSNLVVVKGEKISKLYGKKALVAKDSDILPGLKNADLGKCSHCMVDKQSKVSFKKHPPSRMSELLELLYFDVKSFNGALYFVNVIDDCSRKLWVYTLNSKDQVERQSGKKVKCIHFDNGGEYCGPFDRNKTLIERVKCMLSKVRLPKHLWSETLYTTMHIINLNPAIALNIEYDHLQVFDCKAFVHVPKDERSNLDMKTRQCIFIGYGHDEYGYRMYDPFEKKLVKKRDVQFKEDIDKVKKSTPMKENSLSEIDLVRMPVHDLDTIDNNLGDDFDVPPDDDVEEEQEMSQDENLRDAPEPPSVQLRRSNRHRQSSKRYTSDEYVTLIGGGEPEYYQESMESEERKKAWSKHIDVRYHWICNALDSKLLELAKVHTGDNGVDMLTRVVHRGKFEACCEIARLAITAT
ncbi:hypothetical protein CR513_03516, partial [Mucuna pruriens]